MVDGTLVAALVTPVLLATGYIERARNQEAALHEQLAASSLGMLVWLTLHGCLLITRGQSIGKWLTGIQIVDAESGKLLPFRRVFGYRYLWMLPLVVVVVLVPGTVDDLLLTVAMFLDALAIIEANRRCLHDLIAGSKVVLYRANRQRVS